MTAIFKKSILAWLFLVCVTVFAAPASADGIWDSTLNGGSTVGNWISQAGNYLIPNETSSASPADIQKCVADTKPGTCWSCKFVDIFATKGMESAKNAYNALAPGFEKILINVFGLWLMGQALRMFMPDGNGMAIIKGVGMKFLLLAIILAALNPPGGFAGGPAGSSGAFGLYSQWVFEPIMEGGASISEAIMTSFGVSGGGSSSFQGVFGGMEQVTSTSNDPVVRGVMAKLLNVVSTMQEINTWGFYMGMHMVRGISIMSMEFGQLFGGMTLMAIFGVAVVCFPFFIIDLLFRAILLTALAPVAIASAAFKFSRRVTIAAVSGLIQSAAMVAMLGAVIGLVGALMQHAMSYANQSSFMEWTCNLDYNATNVSFGFDRPEFWFLICSGILSITAMSKAHGMVGALIGSFNDGKSMGDNALGFLQRGVNTAMSGASGVATLAVLSSNAGAAAATHAAAKTITSAMSGGTNTASDLVKSMGTKNMAGGDPGAGG